MTMQLGLIAEPAVTFEVVGLPQSAGSKTPVRTKSGRVILLDGGDDEARQRRRSWRDAVSAAAREAARGLPGPLDGPLVLSIQFRLPMPASRPKHARVRGIAWHSTKPDLSKLVRSTEDAMVAGGLIRDDARICQLTVTKLEAIGWTGASILVGQAQEVPL